MSGASRGLGRASGCFSAAFIIASSPALLCGRHRASSSMPPKSVAVEGRRVSNVPYATASSEGGHPAAADEGLVRFVLVLAGGALHRDVVASQRVGDVETG